MFGRLLNKRLGGRWASSRFRGRRRAAHSRLLTVEELECRQLLSASVELYFGGGPSGDDQGDTEAHISNSGSNSGSYDPSFAIGGTYTVEWSGAASVTGATVGVPPGVLLHAKSANSASITAAPGGHVAETTVGSSADWDDSFIVAPSPVFQEHPFIRLTFQVADNLDPEDNPNDFVAWGVSSANGIDVDENGNPANYIRQPFSNGDLAGSITVDIPVSPQGGFWGGDYHIAAQAGSYPTGATGPSDNSTVKVTSSAELSVSVVSASLADGSTPDFSPKKPDAEITNISWVSGGQGGIDLTYDVEDAPLPKATDVTLYWASGNQRGSIISPAAAVQTTADLGVGPHTISVPAAQFIPPTNDTAYLVAILNQTKAVELKFGDSVKAKDLASALIPPTVQISTVPTAPEKAQPYTVQLTVTNNSPVPLEFTTDYDEVFLKPTGDVNRGAGPGNSAELRC